MSQSGVIIKKSVEAFYDLLLNDLKSSLTTLKEEMAKGNIFGIDAQIYLNNLFTTKLWLQTLLKDFNNAVDATDNKFPDEGEENEHL